MNNNNNLNYSSADALIIALGIFIIVLIITYTYQEYQKIQEERNQKNRKSRMPGECPDYWETVDKNTCRNVHKIGKCGHGNDLTVVFDDKMFTHPRTGDYMKCRWSKECQAPWEHISNLC